VNVIEVVVIYARPDKQYELPVRVAENATVMDAISKSGILFECPEIDLNKQKVGKFSRVCELHDVVNANDRIEIYRALIIDPKERRRLKAKRKS